MKALTTTITALLLATSAQASDCRTAVSNTLKIAETVKTSAQAASVSDLSAQERALAQRKVERRTDSLQTSLISLRVYCHDNPDALELANKLEDAIDAFRTGLL